MYHLLFENYSFFTINKRLLCQQFFFKMKKKLLNNKCNMAIKLTTKSFLVN